MGWLGFWGEGVGGLVVAVLGEPVIIGPGKWCLYRICSIPRRRAAGYVGGRPVSASGTSGSLHFDHRASNNRVP